MKIKRTCRACGTENEARKYEGLGGVAMWTYTCDGCGLPREGYRKPEEADEGESYAINVVYD